MEKYLNVLLVVIILLIMSSCGYDLENDYTIKIVMKNEEFTVLNLTDIQFGKDDVNNENIVNSLKITLEELIEKIKPDLITITGDMSYGEKNAIIHNCELINSYNIPFCVVFGNHDHEERELTLLEQIELYSSYENCLFIPGMTFNDNRVGNYVVNIMDKRGKRIIKCLVFADTGSNEEIYERENEQRINNMNYQKLTDEQVEWINECSKVAKRYGNRKDESIALFIHIPLYEYYNVIRKAYNVDKNKSISDFYEELFEMKLHEERWNEGYTNSTGVIHEVVASYPYDDFVFSRLKNVGLVVAGHEHVNNFIIKDNDTTFVYALKTGLGSYCEEGLNGGTVIKINTNGEINVYHEYIDLT